MDLEIRKIRVIHHAYTIYPFNAISRDAHPMGEGEAETSIANLLGGNFVHVICNFITNTLNTFIIEYLCSEILHSSEKVVASRLNSQKSSLISHLNE